MNLIKPNAGGGGGPSGHGCLRLGTRLIIRQYTVYAQMFVSHYQQGRRERGGGGGGLLTLGSVVKHGARAGWSFFCVIDVLF